MDTSKNQTKHPIKQVILASMFITIGFILPYFTMSNPQLGSMLLPMHIPVILAGLILGPKYGILVGVLTPLLRALLTPSPLLFPVAIVMAIELPVYALTIGLIKRMLPSKFVNLYVALILAMVMGRIAYGIAGFIIYPLAGWGFTLKTFLTAAFITALPGIAIQLAIIPPLYQYLKNTQILNDL